MKKCKGNGMTDRNDEKCIVICPKGNHSEGSSVAVNTLEGEKDRRDSIGTYPKGPRDREQEGVDRMVI